LELKGVAQGKFGTWSVSKLGC